MKASEALKIKDQAEKDRDKAIAEKEQLIAQAEAERQQIIAELEERNKKAQEELDTMTEQAKGVMAEAEEALGKRDSLKKEIEDFDKTVKAKQKELDALTADKRKELDEIESKRAEAESQLTEFYKQQEDLQGDIDGLKGRLDEANRIIEDSKNATVLAEAAAQEIVLNAEKQSVFLKEAALRESEKGKMLSQIEEKEQKIKEIEMEKAELEKKLAALESSVAALEKKVKEGGSVSIASGPKDYCVEVIEHTSAADVDTKKLETVLDKKAKDGWTLVQIIDDDGGKLLSSMGGSSETASLSLGGGGFSNQKQDRLILIFEKPLSKK